MYHHIQAYIHIFIPLTSASCLPPTYVPHPSPFPTHLHKHSFLDEASLAIGSGKVTASTCCTFSCFPEALSLLAAPALPSPDSMACVCYSLIFPEIAVSVTPQGRSLGHHKEWVAGVATDLQRGK